jgi:hypothetical protein
MLRRSEPPGGFELEAVAQDVLIADVDIMAVSPLRMAVALAIAVIPALLIVASYASTLWAARVRSSLTRRDDAGLFAFSPSEHVDPSAGGNSPTPSQPGRAQAVPVRFQDEHGLAWTVTRKAGRQAGRVMLEFVSSAGERRACEVVSLDDSDWEALSESAWRTILQEASGHPDRPR